MIAPVALGIPYTDKQAKRIASIREKILVKVKESAVGKRYLALASERGWNPDERLGEILWVSMFAAYGGTGNLAFETVKLILKKPAKYVKLFRKDEEAFMLEAARHLPPVGGMNPFAVTKEEEVHLIGKKKLRMNSR